MTKHLSILFLLVALAGCNEPRGRPTVKGITSFGGIVRVDTGPWGSVVPTAEEREEGIEEVVRICSLFDKRPEIISELHNGRWTYISFTCIAGDAS